MVEVLKASGSGLDQVVKTTVFLKDMNNFAAMNAVYAKVRYIIENVIFFLLISNTDPSLLLYQFFVHHQPARSAVEVARLPKDVDVEIECIAATD